MLQSLVYKMSSTLSSLFIRPQWSRPVNTRLLSITANIIMQSLQDLSIDDIIKINHKPAEVKLVEPRFKLDDVISNIRFEVVNTLADDIATLEQLSVPQHLKESIIHLRKSRTANILANDIRSVIKLSCGIDMMIEEALERALSRRLILSSDHAHIILAANENIRSRDYSMQVVLADGSQIDFEPDLDHTVNFNICEFYPECSRSNAPNSFIISFKVDAEKPLPSVSRNFVILDQFLQTPGWLYNIV